MIKKILLISLILVPLVVGAEGIADKQIPKAEYLFHLYYDNGQLNADRDFQFKYDIISEEFIQGPLTTQFPYRGEIINVLGEIADHFIFDPKQGDVNFMKGKISVKAPYVADGQKVIFYDSQNQPILTIPVSDSSFCDDDGVCNADRGEDSLSCPKDCKQSLPVPPTATPTPSTGGSNGLWSGILYTLGGLILAGLAWWFFKRRKNTTSLPPPERPASSGRAGTPPNNVDTPPPPNPQNPI
ncbi:MAG: hypothetical protein A2735_03625 [Candidatus Yanofskybacteria bacterium RIFCSPHIGHO2_01_FULL_41_21]|uniref:Uncharacterized protein n=1 Tax=Candidatus Yanofskybacteria bacterium RIFCSPHIGHO2_01_FULL_41_21 TaxID=1802660 RepID=A0A1F8E9X0_9BACT|nr:MAG: hypothetical protein A2735_03625 [Candidatus Yanofskybacteria bacterium RIFCSPHIGHO2_01_FULL_41_21]